MKQRFKIKSRISALWFWVYIYEDLKSMQKEADEFDSLRGMALVEENLLGICQPYERIVFVKGKPTKRHDNIGIIRLSKTHVRTSIVAHEVLHAAFWNYRMAYGSANFGKACSEKEEDLAYIYGELFSHMTVKLYKYKLWK